MSLRPSLSRTLRQISRSYKCESHRVQAVRRFSDKYRSIDDFNKNKKEFQFGPGLDGVEAAEEDRNTPPEGFNGFDVPQPDFLNHERLQGLKPNSAEYKYQMHLIQNEFQQDQEKQRAKWERTERIKGAAAGMLALAGILSVYVVVMNYKYLKQLYKSKFVFDIDDSKVVDLNDPKENLKSMQKVEERMTAEMGPDFAANLKDSASTPGLYLFGAGALKLPTRIPGFDGMFLNDVSVQKDYVVAVDDAGKVYHYSSELSRPVEVHMPQKIATVVYSGGKYYYLSRNRSEIYCGGVVTETTPRSGWFASGANYSVSTIKMPFARGERVKTLDAGASHVLVLTSAGRVFEAITENTTNMGQYGLPKYSPYTSGEHPINVMYELTNLNNEVVAEKDHKYVRPRTLISVAAGRNFNIAIESNGNVWTWGDNAYGQCGREITAANDIQPVPKVAFTAGFLRNVVKYSLPDKAANGTVYVKDAYAGNSTAYIRMRYESEADPQADQDILVGFGAGLKGQLGISRYIHASGTPRVIKSLVGMTEYNEGLNMTQNVGIRHVSAGGDHVFVTLDNAGGKDVVVFGDNEQGQFGNGKAVKSARPMDVPKLIEPADFAGNPDRAQRILARKLNDQSASRLQLLEGRIDGKNVEQVVVACGAASALYYRRK